MTVVPEASYGGFQGYVDLDDLPLYVECVECGTYNLPEDEFCGYCSEDLEVY